MVKFYKKKILKDTSEVTSIQRKFRILSRIRSARFKLSRTPAQNLLDKDVQKEVRPSKELDYIPLNDPTLGIDFFPQIEESSGATTKQTASMYEKSGDIPLPQAKPQHFETFSIPNVTEMEEVGLSQYYNSFLNSAKWQISNLNVKPGDSNFLLWFFMSSYVPLVCSCSGPLSNMFSLFAIICPWKINLQNNSFESDPNWVYIINSISIFFALISNGFLYLNYRKTIRYSYAQVISICGWGIASVILTILLIYYHFWFYRNHKEEEYIIGFGFFFAVITVVLHFTNFILLFANEVGFLLKKYKPVFNIDHTQETLILQTGSLCIWLIIGSSIFTRLMEVSLGESFYYCCVSILTVGAQYYVSSTDIAAQAVTAIWLIIGLIIFGLIVSSIRKMLINSAQSTIYWHRLESMRESTYKHHQDDKLTPKECFKIMQKTTSWTFAFEGLSEVGISLFLFMFSLLCGALAFSLWESWTYRLSVYFCFFNLLTLGQGNQVPETPGGMVFFSIWSLTAIPVMTIFVSTASDFVLSKITSYESSKMIDIFTDFCIDTTGFHTIGNFLKKGLTRIDNRKLLKLTEENSVMVHFDETHERSDSIDYPLSSHPVDLLVNILLDPSKVDNVSFINSAPYVQSNTLAVHLANYNREGLTVEFNKPELFKTRQQVVQALMDLDPDFDLQNFYTLYRLPHIRLPKGIASAGVVNKENIIQTSFRKKEDFVLSSLSKMEVTVLELKRAAILMCTDPEYKHSFEEWDKFFKITKSNQEFDKFWLKKGNPLSFPLHEPSYFVLHYLRYLDLLIQKTAAEWDAMDSAT
ncbi:Tok1 protein [Martiniozyma asiatica (nom. inval.)]|nr:Tok1 protein [Martiniozyma asiatica]